MALSKFPNAAGLDSQTNLTVSYRLTGDISRPMCRRSSLPDQRRDTLKAVLIKLGITRVLADLAEDIDETRQDTLV